ncbi:amidase domain-containing protein [Agromyces soli]|uniref:Amidase domain-containing protein n=1 Tax=Agromyces soli TaxID=659012 RepID=A0ABY4AWN6_9MICO|nr:amidase domain-containing protein [Agromyces soli]UOE26812.1 amidase domain-containing protein [Agromyces soli]
MPDISPDTPARRPKHRAAPNSTRASTSTRTSTSTRAPSARGLRRVAALSGASAILGVTAFGAVSAAGADGAPAPASLAAEAAPLVATGDELSVTPGGSTVSQVEQAPVVTSGLSVAAAPFTGGTQVTVQGEALDEVAAVQVGGAAATIVSAEKDQLTFAVPAVAETALGSVAVTMTEADGTAVAAETPASPATASFTAVHPLVAAASPVAVPSELSLTYTSDPGIDAQLGYVLAYWSDYNTDAYTVISGNDCANFTSQSLIARGWTMDGDWYSDAATGAMSASWSSSTAMRDWLLGRPDLATPLDDSQRAQVKVGDIAQFDWDASGDRDHTAIVTRVEHGDAGTRIWVGGHTKDADYWDVDEAIAGGGTVNYFSVK